MSTVEQTRPILPADLEGRSSGGGDSLLVSVVIPCLNEAENIERCVRTALEVLARNALAGEVLVVDNASEDDSAALAPPPAPASCTSPAAATAAPTSPASPPRAGATS